MWATFNRFEIRMTRTQAESVSHSGRCDDDVEMLVKVPAIARQLRKIGPDAIRAELREYGAWNAEELADDCANARRIVWCAGCDIREECAMRA
jgi:hypothetical protein